MTLGPRPALALTLPAIAVALLMLASTAGAQEAPKGDLERAQKAADAVFHWIKINADKGASRRLRPDADAERAADRREKQECAAQRRLIDGDSGHGPFGTVTKPGPTRRPWSRLRS